MGINKKIYYILIIMFSQFLPLCSATAVFSRAGGYDPFVSAEEARSIATAVATEKAATIATSILSAALVEISVKESLKENLLVMQEASPSLPEERVWGLIENKLVTYVSLLEYMKNDQLDRAERFVTFVRITGEKSKTEEDLEMIQILLQHDIADYREYLNLLREDKIDCLFLVAWRDYVIELTGIAECQAGNENKDVYDESYLKKTLELLKPLTHPYIQKIYNDPRNQAIVLGEIKAFYASNLGKTWQETTCLLANKVATTFREVIYQDFYSNKKKEVLSRSTGNASQLVKRSEKLKSLLPQIISLKNDRAKFRIRWEEPPLPPFRPGQPYEETIASVSQGYVDKVNEFIGFCHNLGELERLHEEVDNEVNSLPALPLVPKPSQKKHGPKPHKKRRLLPSSIPAQPSGSPSGSGDPIVGEDHPPIEDAPDTSEAVVNEGTSSAPAEDTVNRGHKRLQRIPARERWRISAERMYQFLQEKTTNMDNGTYRVNPALEDELTEDQRTILEEFLQSSLLRARVVKGMLRALKWRVPEGVEVTISHPHPPRGYLCEQHIHFPHAEGQEIDRFVRFLILEALKRAGFFV